MQKQIASGATEQFERFGFIQKSIQDTLSTHREEVNRQLSEFRQQMEIKLTAIQKAGTESNEQIEGRLSQSFELASKQLESVGQGLGEMKALAADAKSLKNALTNVKERGTYGEVRLEKLLSDILAPSQYEMNVEIANGKRVEFAIKPPGNGNEPLLLPIDSKFPIEDYNRLLGAEDKQSIEDARRSLTGKIRTFAKDIHDKYIVPPINAIRSVLSEILL